MNNIRTGGLDINYENTEQLIIGREGNDMVLGPNTIRDCVRFKYLGVMTMKESTSNEEIDNKIIQGRKAIRKLNSVLLNDKITRKTKHMIVFNFCRVLNVIYSFLGNSPASEF